LGCTVPYGPEQERPHRPHADADVVALHQRAEVAQVAGEE